jgi:hypothetical protein
MVVIEEKRQPGSLHMAVARVVLPRQGASIMDLLPRELWLPLGRPAAAPGAPKRGRMA